MKKSILTLTMIMTISLFAEDFKDKHFKCTLIEKNGEYISERQAESLNKFKKDVFVSKTKLKLGYETFEYKDTDNYDIYSQHLFSDDYNYAYIDYGNFLHIKRVVTTIYEEVENASGASAYENEVNESSNKLIEKLNTKAKERDKEREKEQSTYSCTEATFIEKIKYKYDNF